MSPLWSQYSRCIFAVHVTLFRLLALCPLRVACMTSHGAVVYFSPRVCSSTHPTSTLEQDHYSKATALILESSPSVFNFAVSDRTPSPQALHSIGPEQLLQAPSQSLPSPPRARRRCQQWPDHIPQTEKTMCSCTRHAFAQMVQCCRNTLGQLTRLGRVIATLLPLG